MKSSSICEVELTLNMLKTMAQDGIEDIEGILYLLLDLCLKNSWFVKILLTLDRINIVAGVVTRTRLMQ